MLHTADTTVFLLDIVLGFRIIESDQEYSGIGGMETATKLTGLDNVGRVYLVTANVSNNIEDDAESRGIGLLFKPFSIEKLRDACN